MISSFALVGSLLLGTQAMAVAPRCANILSGPVPVTINANKKEMVTLARSIFQVIENNYGPLQLKKTTMGLDYKTAKRNFYASINDTKSESDLLFKFANFLFQFNDAHISIELPSSLVWVLPMQVSFDSTTNKYILNAIDRQNLTNNLLSGELPPLGAELISIDGKTIDDFRKENMYFNHTGNELTNRNILGSKLFKLSEATGIPLSKMENSGRDFGFQWIGAEGKVVKTITRLTYNTQGVGLIDADSALPTAKLLIMNLAEIFKFKEKSKEKNNPKIIAELPVVTLVEGINQLFNTEVQLKPNGKNKRQPNRNLNKNDFENLDGNLYEIGQTAPLFKLPADFTKIELPDFISEVFDETQIFAGTFNHNGKKVALLRIPSYALDSDSIAIAPLAIDYLIRRLEASSDYMILDQMHNPGGQVVYSDFWINALVGKFNLTKHLHFRVKPTSGFIQQFAEIYSELDKTTMGLPAKFRQPLLDETHKQLEIVQEAFRSGKTLSDPITLLPMSQLLQEKLLFMMMAQNMIQPDLFMSQPEYSPLSRATYTKPIYMLIDSLDFSGGDATPASLQDYGRVKLVGQRTAGAGGTVEEFSAREMHLQFIYRMTTSLMYRPANMKTPYIENYGVQPDIALAPTAQDLVDGYQSYLPRLLQLIDQDMGQNN